jgi:septal ring factor EnvC (AmiA/AmiB activator)
MTRRAGRGAPASAGRPGLHAVLPVLFASAVLTGVPTPSSAQPTAKEVAARRADLGDLRERIDALRKELAAAEATRSDATDQLRASEQRISELRRDMRVISTQQRSVEKQLLQLNKEQSALGTQIDEQQRQVAALLRRQYLGGATDPLKEIFSGRSPQQISRDLVYLAHLAEARHDLAASLAAKRARAQSLAADARDHSNRLADLAAAHQAQQQVLDKQRQEHQNVLGKAAAEVSARRKEIGALQRDQERLSKLVIRLTKLLAARPKPPPPSQTTAPSPGGASGPLPDKAQRAGPFADLRGHLRLPVSGSITHRFGSAREGGQWKGLFIKSAAGSEIRAIAPGRVVYADWMRGFGNLLILDHGDDYLSIYGHNEALLLQVGELVAVGDPIASVGSTGGRAETGLYFELRHRGLPIDPLTWVAAR